MSLSQDAVALQRLIVEAEKAKRELADTARVQISLPFLARASSGPVEQFFGTRPSLRVNPDEAVAAGAALLSASLEGRLPEVAFVDVAPRSIGLRAAGDRYAPLIPRSTQLPAEASRGFATTQPDQRSFELQVLQGEDEVASKNRRLANLVLEPISPGPAGQVRLRVTFTVDEQGRLAVRAREVGSDAETRGAIQPVSGLGRAEVQRLAAERRKQRGTAEAAAVDPAVLAPAVPIIEFVSPGSRGSPPRETPSRAPAPAPAPALGDRRGNAVRAAIAIAVLAALAVLGYLLAR